MKTKRVCSFGLFRHEDILIEKHTGSESLQGTWGPHTILHPDNVTDVRFWPVDQNIVEVWPSKGKS